MDKLVRFYTDRDFGGVDFFRLALTGVALVACVFAVMALTGNLPGKCREETGPRGHLYTVCGGGGYEGAEWEHSVDCPVTGCPYAMEGGGL